MSECHQSYCYWLWVERKKIKQIDWKAFFVLIFHCYFCNSPHQFRIFILLFLLYFLNEENYYIVFAHVKIICKNKILSKKIFFFCSVLIIRKSNQKLEFIVKLKWIVSFFIFKWREKKKIIVLSISNVSKEKHHLILF